MTRRGLAQLTGLLVFVVLLVGLVVAATFVADFLQQLRHDARLEGFLQAAGQVKCPAHVGSAWVIPGSGVLPPIVGPLP